MTHADSAHMHMATRASSESAPRRARACLAMGDLQV